MDSANMSVVAPTALYNPARRAEARAWVRYHNIARLAGFVGIACSPFALWALFWTSPRDYPFLSSMLFVPLVIYGCVMLFSRLWRRDRFVKLLFGAGITLRLAAAGAYVWLGFFVFNVSADAFHYWTMGLFLANEFSGLGWAAFRPPWWSTNLIFNICGIITLVTGNAMPTLFVIFALAALWGGYFFYRAFCIAFPEWNRGQYGLLIVLLPSILYWSSAIGKDAMEQLFIGISAYGFARSARRLDVGAIIISVIGVTGAAAFRPHVGAMLAISMLLSFTLAKGKGGWMTVLGRILLVPVLVGCTYFMLKQAQSFVGAESADLKSGAQVLEKRNIGTQVGGSPFDQGESLTRRIAQGPFLLFRPFPWEVHSFLSAVAAVEGLALWFVAWRKRRELWALRRKWRDPYIGFILAFALQFSIIFAAAISNFGILVRQRIMLAPIVLMLFCAKLPARKVVAAPLARRRFLVPYSVTVPAVGPVIP
jgi:hypothetical protein